MKRSMGMAAAAAAFFLLAVACGNQDPEPLPSAPSLVVRMGAGLGAVAEAKTLRLRAWGPWWAPLWSHALPDRGEVSFPFTGPLEGLHWFTLEAAGVPVAGVRVIGGLEEPVYHLTLGELEVPRSAMGAEGLEPLPVHDPSVSYGFPAGGIALDRGSRAALLTFSSPELHLRALWLLPWRAPEGRYGVVQVEDMVVGEPWGGPDQVWVLQGPAVELLAPSPIQRLFSAGCRLEPWPGGADLPEARSRPTWWAPAWEVETRPDGLILFGHADWRRYFLTVPRAQSVDLLALWHAPTIRGAEEDPPRALWRIDWAADGRRLAHVQVMPRFLGLLPALSLRDREWALLRLQESGGMGAGLEVGGAPLSIGLEGPGPPLLLLETQLTQGATAFGLLFWPPGSQARLELGPDRSHALGHRDTVLVSPSFEGPRAATTRLGGR